MYSVNAYDPGAFDPGAFDIDLVVSPPVDPDVPPPPPPVQEPGNVGGSFVNTQSKVAIVNLALAKLGSRPIQSLQDPVKSARVMGAIYDTIADQELARHFWKFALKRRLIDEALSTEPRGPFRYVYPLPSDWLTSVWIGNLPTGITLDRFEGDPLAEWAHEGRMILSNEAAPLALLYVARVTDSTLYHTTFVEMLSCRLAMEAAASLTDSSTRWEMAREQYQEARREAKRLNAIMDPPRYVSGDSWLDARH